jgi:hypothetical protein
MTRVPDRYCVVSWTRQRRSNDDARSGLIALGAFAVGWGERRVFNMRQQSLSVLVTVTIGDEGRESRGAPQPPAVFGLGA